MSHVPNDEANLLARLASPDPAERWRASGDVYARFFNDVRRITLKWQGRRLSVEEARDIAQEAFKQFMIRAVREPFVAEKIWGVREYILDTARHLVVRRLKKPDPGAAQKRELDLARLGGEADAGSGDEPATECTSPDAPAAADPTELVDEGTDEAADDQPGSDTAAPDVATQWTSPGPVELTELPEGILDRLVIAAFDALTLSEKDRDILRLASTKSRTHEEIALMYGTSAGYIKKRYCVLKQRLEACIESLLSGYDAATTSVIRRRLNLPKDKEPSV